MTVAGLSSRLWLDIPRITDSLAQMRILKPPTPWLKMTGDITVFLGGTIECGRSTDWQGEFVDIVYNRLYHIPQIFNQILFLNPRRSEWDASWKTSMDFQPFREQVEWELNGLEQCDLMVMNFLPGSNSMITLMELGLFHDKAIVCCPDGYCRKGNVDIVCERYQVPQVQTLEALSDAIVTKILQTVYTRSVPPTL